MRPRVWTLAATALAAVIGACFVDIADPPAASVSASSAGGASGSGAAAGATTAAGGSGACGPAPPYPQASLAECGIDGAGGAVEAHPVLYSSLDDLSSITRESGEAGVPVFMNDDLQCPGHALEVKDKDGWVQFPYEDPSLGERGTVSFWFRRTSEHQDKQRLFSLNAADLTLEYTWSLPLADSWMVDAGDTMLAHGELAQDTWAHVVMTWDFSEKQRQQVHLFVNGTLLEPDPRRCLFEEDPKQMMSFELGAREGSETEFAVGDFDDLKIYNVPIRPKPM
jgi:hypothetical protein